MILTIQEQLDHQVEHLLREGDAIGNFRIHAKSPDKHHDVLTLGVLLDALTVARNAGYKPIHDSFWVVLGFNGMRQLFADQQFLIAYSSRFKSSQYDKGQIFELLGMTFCPRQIDFGIDPLEPSDKPRIVQAFLFGAQAAQCVHVEHVI